MPTDNDTPADERCESCDRLDPVNCSCPPEPAHAYRVDWEIGVDLATEETEAALRDVADERVRQVAKWGVQTRPDGTRTDLAEVADAAKKRTDRAARNGTLTWLHILEEEVLEAFAETDPGKLRTELLQVAAVAIAWAEDLDRKDAVAPARVVLGIDVDAAIADGRLPLRQPGGTS